jgi:hypothetical protein
VPVAEVSIYKQCNLKSSNFRMRLPTADSQCLPRKPKTVTFKKSKGWQAARKKARRGGTIMGVSHERLLAVRFPGSALSLARATSQQASEPYQRAVPTERPALRITWMSWRQHRKAPMIRRIAKNFATTAFGNTRSVS